jgi:membrane protease YdiL (CAAX protease family)
MRGRVGAARGRSVLALGGGLASVGRLPVDMSIKSIPQSGGLKKSGFFLVGFVLEAMVFAILPLSARLPINRLLYLHGGLTILLLVAALLLRTSERGRKFWQVFYVLFVAGAAILLSTLFSDRLLDLFRLATGSPPWIAIAKLSESLLRVIPIFVLTMVIGADRRSLYLHRGKLGLGLAVGIAGFVGFAGLAFIPLAKQAGMLNKLLSLSPWIFIFVLANGFMEELLYRGLFLKRFEPFLGKGLSNLLTASVFTLSHVQVTYASDVFKFLLVVFPLALIWGYLMQKTDSLWGSVLFHVGADCMIIFGIYASM